MNKIYKVIWSKVKHQYVVVSELAHRDGKRSSAEKGSLRSRLAALAVCGAFALFGGLGAQDIMAAAPDGGLASIDQYVAYKYNGSDENDGYTKVWVKDKNNPSNPFRGQFYWVRDGYTVEGEYVKKQDDSGTTFVISKVYAPNGDVSDVLVSSKVTIDGTDVITNSGEELNSVELGNYAAVSNGGKGGAEANTSCHYIIETENGWENVGVGTDKFDTYFKTTADGLKYDEDKGTYTYNGEVVSSNNIYYISDGKTTNAGVFVVNGEVYKSTVYGNTKEILTTAKDKDGSLKTFWSTDAESNDIYLKDSNLKVGDLNTAFAEVEANEKKLHNNDVKEITLGSNDNKIGLVRNSGKEVDGSIYVSSIVGKDGNAQVKFAQKDEHGRETSSFVVDAGSIVEAKTEEGSTNLTGLTIDGETYGISSGGKSVTSGIIETDGSVRLYQGKDDKTGVTLDNKIHDWNVTGGKIDDEGTLTLNQKDEYGGKPNSVSINGVASTNYVNSSISTSKTAITNEYKKYFAANDNYVESGAVSEDGKKLTLTMKDNTTVDIGLSDFAEGFSSTDYRLVANPAEGSGEVYKPVDGDIELTVKDGKTGKTEKVKLSDIASAETLQTVSNRVGTTDYSSTNYIADNDSLTTAAGKLDKAIKNTENEAKKHTTVTVYGEKADSNDKNLILQDNGTNGQHQYDLKLNDDIYLGGNQTADNRNIALEGSTGSIHAATTEGNNTFDFDSNGGKFETKETKGTSPFLKTTTHTATFDNAGATFTKKTSGFLGETTFTNINGSKIISQGDELLGTGLTNKTVIDGKKVTAGDIKVNNESGATITGLSNQKINYAGFGGGRAATEAQLKLMQDQISDDLTVTASDGIAINKDNKVSVNAGAGLGFSKEANEKGTKELEVKVGSNLEINDQNQVDLKDNITLGAAEGPHIQLNGTPPKGENNVVSIVDGNSNELFTIGQDGLVSSDGDVIADADGGKYSLSEVSQSAVRYDKNGDGTVNHNSVTLASTDEYMTVKDSAGHVISGAGGTTLKNVAYASGEDGSEAVNVDYLTTQLDKSQGAVVANERHIATSGDVNPDDGKQFSGTYAVNRADGTISLTEVDGNGKPTNNTLVLKDIASATDLKNLDEGAVKYWRNEDGTYDKSYIELAGGEEGTVINHVADGFINENSKQAVNGSQLWKVQELAGKHTTMTVNGGTAAPEDGSYTTDGNLQLKQKVGDKGQIEYDVKLSDDIVLSGSGESKEEQDNRVTLSGTNGTIMATTNFNDMSATTTINGGNVYVGSSVSVGDTVVMTDKDITGLSNITWNGKTDDVSRAATEGQLRTVSDKVNGGWTATDDVGNKINVNPTNSTLNFASGKNVTVSAADGEISVSLNDEVKLGDYDNGTGIYLSGASGTISATNSISVGEDLVIDGNKKTVNGLSNKTWSKDSFVSGQAATEDQLDAMADWTEKQVNNSGWTASTNGGKEDEKTEAITNGETVDFSNTDGNIKVSQDVTANGTSIKFNLNDDLLLGANADEGAGINLSGTAGAIAIKSANGSTINIGNGVITGLTNTVSNENWETFMNSDLGNNGRAVTEDDLQLVAQHSVQYKTNDDGTIDYNNIFLSGASYSSDGHTGGTMITNVAYASDSDGSAAVNVDKLHDAISDAKTEVTNADKHLNYDKTYSVDRETNKVNLEVVDNQGNVVGNTTIEDVASATDVGNIGDLNSDIAHDSTGDGNVSIVDAVNNVDNKVGDLNYKHDDGSDLNYVTAGDSVTGAIGDLDAAIKDAATEAGQHSSVSGSNNITVAENGTNGNGGTDYKVSLKDDLTLGGKEGQNGSIAITGSEGTITASGNVSAGSFTTGSITINGANEDGTHTSTINGLSNKTWDANNIVPGQAATEDQLKAATEGAVQYDRNEDGTVNKGSITLGGSTYNEERHEGGTTITNVADGKNASDAVNMSQLWQTNQAVINNSNNIQSLSNQVGKLDNRIDEVGAGAAALAALHPLDFDPDDKWDFSAGYGNYRGESAVAVGAFYRPNEDTMFSVGGTVGNGDNMVNAGVSFKIGQGNSVSTSRVAMAKEIKSMRDIVAKQDAQIQKLTAMVNALVGIQAEPDTTTMFPDVPENHWAYEAVAAMAKGGLVKGYPDGEFKGDRTMTRYEFAQIVYNAIQAGAEVDSRLVAEFQPELEYFHIATVAKDKDGNPTIERVRAN